MSTQPNIIRLTLSAQLVGAIRVRLLSCEPPPGARLSELELTRVYSVSRPPIREACRILECEGLLQTRPGHGYVVSRPSSEDAVSLFQLRLSHSDLIADLIERRSLWDAADLCVSMQALQSNLETDGAGFFEANLSFHHELAAKSGNSFLLNDYIRVFQLLRLFRLSALVAGEGSGHDRALRPEIVRDHWDIVRALESRDGNQLSSAMRKQVRRSVERSGLNWSDVS